MHGCVWREFYADKTHDPFMSIVSALSRIHGYVEKFGTRNIAFCFDFPPYKRSEIFPGYKEKTVRADLESAYNETTLLMRDLHQKEILQRMGFRNVFSAKGYEADDLFAGIVQNLEGEDRVIIISEDMDLYQLLSWRCAIFHPRKQQFVTARSFRQEYGISPNWWKGAKAIAGDDGDKIPGVKGVGIKMAIEYMQGTLKSTNKRRGDVDEWVDSLDHQRNLRLISLPFPGLCPMLLREDKGYDARLVSRFFEVLGREAPAEERRKETRVGIQVEGL
jgi:5'-3' exonuclease